MDVHFKFSPPVQLLFHEQAKSIIALQELQSEVSSLLEFKNVLLESYPHLLSKIKKTREVSNSSVSNTHLHSQISDKNPDFFHQDPSSWIANFDKSSQPHPDVKGHSHQYTTNVSDSGFGNSTDLKDSSSSMNISQGEAQFAHQSFLIDELNDDELLLLLDVIHEKTVRMTKASNGSLKSQAHFISKNNDSQNSCNIRAEIESLKREKEFLLNRIMLLESQKDKTPPRNSPLNSSCSGNDIVHSVHIRTSDPPGNNSVNIEIKGSPIIEKCKKSTESSSEICSGPKFSSELNVSSKIGKTDKLDLSELAPLQAIILLRDSKKYLPNNKNIPYPNRRVTREKIRKILNINNVIELQRQLLATVMEKEVYKSHLEKLCETWTEKKKEFEYQNESLQISLLNLKSENESLKSQVLCKQKNLNANFVSPFMSSTNKDPVSWNETNNGVDEILTKSPHIISSSISNPLLSAYMQPDSLLEDEECEVNSRFIHNKKFPNDEYFDSISLQGDLNRQNLNYSKNGRKLIIPYMESPSKNLDSNQFDPDKIIGGSSPEAGVLSKIPITEKLKKKILGW